MVQGDPGTAQAGDRTWHCPCDAGFAGMLRFQRRAGSRSLLTTSKRELCEAVKVKLKMQWRPQEVRDIRNTCLPRKVACSEQSQPKREANGWKLESIILSEASQVQKAKGRMCSLTCVTQTQYKQHYEKQVTLREER
jgi:hypothetical protein